MDEQEKPTATPSKAAPVRAEAEDTSKTADVWAKAKGHWHASEDGVAYDGPSWQLAAAAVLKGWGNKHPEDVHSWVFDKPITEADYEAGIKAAGEIPMGHSASIPAAKKGGSR